MLKEGDKVPSGLLHTSFDGVIPGKPGPQVAALADLVPANKALVLFFYPKDSTPGCTREAKGFTDARQDFAKANAVIVGVSRDSPKSHASFCEKFSLSLPLLSDPERLLHEGFGAWGEKTMYGKKVLGTIRSTFLIKNGTVLRAWPNVKVDGHIEQVLAAVRGDEAKAFAKPTAAASPKAAGKSHRTAKPKAAVKPKARG